MSTLMLLSSPKQLIKHPIFEKVKIVNKNKLLKYELNRID